MVKHPRITGTRKELEERIWELSENDEKLRLQRENYRIALRKAKWEIDRALGEEE